VEQAINDGFSIVLLLPVILSITSLKHFRFSFVYN